MINKVRWIMIGAAMMLVAVAFAWSCGGSGGTSCVTSNPYLPCEAPSAPGPYIQSISVCPGSAVPPTPVSTSTASPLPTPLITTCPTQIVTALPTAGLTFQFHAIGTYSNGVTVDITNNTGTSWTSSDVGVADPNSSPAGSYYAPGCGSATINAVAGGLSGKPAPMVFVLPIPCPTPTP
jgi:hypothetical protein